MTIFECCGHDTDTCHPHCADDGHGHTSYFGPNQPLRNECPVIGIIYGVGEP